MPTDATDQTPHPLQARWDITCQRLTAAADFIRPQSDTPDVQRCFAEYAEFLDHNELECVLNILESACESFTPSPDTFELLALAAESLDLHERASVLRRLIFPPTSKHLSNATGNA